jgi:hypothetical protein
VTITAPIGFEAALDIIDDIQIIDDLQLAPRAAAVTRSTLDPLVPFLLLGLLSFVVTVVAAAILAF